MLEKHLQVAEHEDYATTVQNSLPRANSKIAVKYIYRRHRRVHRKSKRLSLRPTHIPTHTGRGALEFNPDTSLSLSLSLFATGAKPPRGVRQHLNLRGFAEALAQLALCVFCRTILAAGRHQLVSSRRLVRRAYRRQQQQRQPRFRD